MARSVFDCSRVPNGKTCSVQIIGNESDVRKAAQHHLETTHGRAGEANLKENVASVVSAHAQTTPYANIWV
jgi:hypothetical protein